MAEATGIPALDGVRRQNDSGDVTGGGGGGGRVGGDDGGEGAVDLTGEGDGCDEATATRAHGDGAGLEDPPGDAGAATADGPGGPDGDGRLAAAAAAHSQAPESRRHRRGSAGNADAGGTGENGGGEASDAASRAVELLTQGLVSHYLPDLQRAGRSLSELTVGRHECPRDDEPLCGAVLRGLVAVEKEADGSVGHTRLQRRGCTSRSWWR
ncbi:biogenesis of lysosome-related organelles complex 1 subunit 6 isoform X2 [Petromyzon marinus]|uniref:biogenesis of lysosome-related organelles complex 1 subunit 6 isoform X2 n=1 Tax=Petromyzon marinus TaxID=7757 RepID=UPI003F6F022F